MKNKKLLLAAGIGFTMLLCLITVIVFVLVLTQRENTVESEKEAKEILINTLEKNLNVLENNEKVQAKLTSEFSGFSDDFPGTVTFALDGTKEMAVIEYNDLDLQVYYTKEKTIVCYSGDCSKNFDDLEGDAKDISYSLPESYDDFQADIDELANSEFFTGSDGETGVNIREEIEKSAVEYDNNVDCGIDGEQRCYNISYSSNEQDFIKSESRFLINIDTEQIMQVEISFGGITAFTLEFNYGFEIEIPDAIEDIAPSEPAKTSNSSGQDVRNAQRSQDVMVILEAINQYTNNEGNSQSDFGPIKACENGSDSIGIAAENIDLDLYLVDEYLSEIPEDPSDGDFNDTGYDICLTPGKRIRISAPLAEGDAIIEVEG